VTAIDGVASAYSGTEKLRYRISLRSNEAGKTTVYGVWRETAPGSNELEIYGQWAGGPANLLIEICDPVRPRPPNVTVDATGAATGAGGGPAPARSGFAAAFSR
jgi:hypothetical protein